MWQQRPNKKPRLSIILTEDVHNLGVKGQIVKVRHGYGRNYLLPQGFAEYATPYNIKKYDAFEVKPGSSFKGEPEDLPSFLSDKVLTVYHDPNSKLAVFEQDIARAFRQSFQIYVPLDSIELDEPIVNYDEHSVLVRLDENTTVRMPVVVRPKTKSEEVEKLAEPTAFVDKF
jgi:large subunit ribosomal protein L9